MIVHIYNRGVDKRKTFETSRDYNRFVEYLYLCNSRKEVRYDNLQRYKKYKNVFDYEISETLVDIGAWCIMPNHFHILISISNQEDLSKFMQKITTAYSMYFNKKNNRTGALFAGTYKQKFVEDDNYYSVLWNYIHLNPLDLFPGNNGDILEKYKYSSLLEFFKIDGQRDEAKILNLKNFPEVKFKSWRDMKEVARGVQTEQG